MGQKKKKSDGENNKNSGDGGKNEETPAPVVLKIDMHCDGCASKIMRFLRDYEGVETVKAESGTGKLTITGKVDPTKVRDKLAANTKKEVELISPQPKKEKENNKDAKPDNKSEKKNDDKKPKEPPVTTALLKVSLHCQGCVDRIRKTVSKTKGVYDMTIDKEKDTITVKGTMDVKALVGKLTERLKRKVEVVPPKKEKDKDKDKDNDRDGATDKEGGNGKKNKQGGGRDNEKGGEEGGADGGGKMEYLVPAYGYVYGINGYNYGPVYLEHLYAPQMFSDENPNACTIM